MQPKWKAHKVAVWIWPEEVEQFTNKSVTISKWSCKPSEERYVGVVAGSDEGVSGKTPRIRCKGSENFLIQSRTEDQGQK